MDSPRLFFVLGEHIASLEAEVKRLHKLAYTDHLTGVPNKRAFDEFLSKAIGNARRAPGRRSGDKIHQSLSLAFIDIDDFKLVNDRYGHGIGDEVLTRLPKVVRGIFRDDDLFARIGGEEFGVVFTNCTNINPQEILERLREAIEKELGTVIEQSGKYKITVSIGLTSLEETDDTTTICTRADMALYDAKESGKNRIVVL